LCEFKNQARDQLLANWEILFEVFCLKNEVKMTARARPAGPNFLCFINAAEKSGLRILKTGKAGTKTQAVAVWSLGKLGPTADAIAEGVRGFLATPPKSLMDFIVEIQSCCLSRNLGTGPSSGPRANAATLVKPQPNCSLPPSSPPVVNAAALCPNQQQLIELLVRWIQDDPYPRLAPSGVFHTSPASTPQNQQVVGWDQRFNRYAYAKSKVLSGGHLTHFFPPLGNRFQALTGNLAWSVINDRNQIAPQIIDELEWLSETTCIWGGVAKPTGYLDTWSVLKSAFLGRQLNSAPMDSGWTKVASFATAHSPKIAQTIWDSRVSTSVIWRSDQILPVNCVPPGVFQELFLIPSAGPLGTRPRPLTGRWRTRTSGGPRAASEHWVAHFAGSAVVRGMVTVLNDPANNYPQMPLLGGGVGAWDVFGVGLVLFMDGY
jgi:hypothetical protein